MIVTAHAFELRPHARERWRNRCCRRRHDTGCSPPALRSRISAPQRIASRRALQEWCERSGPPSGNEQRRISYAYDPPRQRAPIALRGSTMTVAEAPESYDAKAPDIPSCGTAEHCSLFLPPSPVQAPCGPSFRRRPRPHMVRKASASIRMDGRWRTQRVNQAHDSTRGRAIIRSASSR